MLTVEKSRTPPGFGSTAPASGVRLVGASLNMFVLRSGTMIGNGPPRPPAGARRDSSCSRAGRYVGFEAPRLRTLTERGDRNDMAMLLGQGKDRGRFAARPRRIKCARRGDNTGSK